MWLPDEYSPGYLLLSNLGVAFRGTIIIMFRIVEQNGLAMIKSFKHKGLKKFFLKNDSSGLEQHLVPRIQTRLTTIDAADTIEGIDIPNYDLHQLKGDRKDVWSIKVSGNWRITFRFVDGDAEIVNLEDYH